MSTRMLIDARHPEETRVTVVKGSRVEDFDFESATRRQLKGNIYLARITRVEPSLQAAFVEYGGNRHGFLAFSEIHPDYYQIPLEDREAIIEEETQAAAAEQADEEREEADAKKRRPRRRRGRKPATEAVENADATVSEDVAEGTEPETSESGKPAKDEQTPSSEAQDTKSGDVASISDVEEAKGEDTVAGDDAPENGDDNDANEDANGDADADDADVKESDEEDKDAEIEAVAASRRRNVRAVKRRYSIQEVIKRRQVLLIQVVKEERGNKGAALTTYMSLAGRYCVLMPNSTHSGGISRKISNLSDRKKLKQVINSLEVPEGMGLIVRTAGINRTKTEIKRDYDYLLRLWNGIRDLTLKSTAPALIYEEGSLIKRTIRDVYTRDIDEVWVEGERGYRAAKDFMKLLMPSHAKKVQHYKDRIPLYQRYQVENQLEAMYQPVVQLRSGGYIVINPTEALISIDVNSGRATKEHNIEETAVKTNLEAAEEVARQLRLRDMAGLVVIDYIDMEESRNNRAVERRMKDVLKGDRARIQVGRISSFGLMEMSRQRLRPNLLEVAMETCGHCSGTGLVRSVESAAIMTLRQLEEEGIRNRSSLIRAKVNPDVAVYLLNQKRAVLSDLEQEYKLTIHIMAEISMAPSDVEITHEVNTEVTAQPRSEGVVVKMDSSDAEMEESGAEAIAVKEASDAKPEPEQDDQPRKKRRRRRRRRRGGPDDNDTPQAAGDTRDNDGEETATGTDTGTETGTDTKSEASDATDDETKSEGPTRRRRGSRGGRRRRGRDGTKDTATEQPVTSGEATADAAAPESEGTEPKTTATAADGPADKTADSDTEAKPVRRRRRVRKAPDDQATAAQSTDANTAVEASSEGDNKDAPKRASRRRAPVRKAGDKETSDTSATENAGEKPAETGDKPAPRRRRTAKSARDTDVTAANTEGKPETPAEPKPRGRRKAAASVTDTSDNGPATADAKASAAADATATADKPKRRQAPAKEKTAAKKADSKSQEAPSTDKPGEGQQDGPKRSGWWQRTFG